MSSLNVTLFATSVPGYRDHQLVEVNKEDTTNAKNGRNRKICPITFVELNPDNSVQIGKTIYSNKGLFKLFNSKLPDQRESGFHQNYEVIRRTIDPMTNLPFTESNAIDICALFLGKHLYS